MHVHDLLEKQGQTVHICSEFITQTNGLPLYRNLITDGDAARRVKVRQRKVSGLIASAFNEAFQDRHRNIFQRAVFASTSPGLITETTEPFYIFPTNGFRFLYCTEVQKTQLDFQNAIDALFEQFEDQTQAVEVLKDLLTFTYTDHDIKEGIEKGAEIIIYNIPSFVAVRCSSVGDYTEAIGLLD